jgi:tRNA-Thr(GGU) m(6)t(6)A37 methyltransferase TsaA
MIPEKTLTPARKQARGKRGASLRAIGVLRSPIKTREKAPKQGSEDASEASLEVRAFAAPALEGLAEGDDIIVLAWLHQSRRDVLKVHPRGDRHNPLTDVFATRSPARPNPIGLHRVLSGRLIKIGCSSVRWRPSTAHRSSTSSPCFQASRITDRQCEDDTNDNGGTSAAVSRQTAQLRFGR